MQFRHWHCKISTKKHSIMIHDHPIYYNSLNNVRWASLVGCTWLMNGSLCSYCFARGPVSSWPVLTYPTQQNRLRLFSVAVPGITPLGSLWPLGSFLEPGTRHRFLGLAMGNEAIIINVHQSYLIIVYLSQAARVRKSHALIHTWFHKRFQALTA